MEYIFLFMTVTPLALLVLNLTGFRASAVEVDAPLAFETPAAAPAVAVTVPAAEPVVKKSASFTPAALAASTVPSGRSGGLVRGKRQRRDFFGDYAPMATVESFASEPVHEGAEIYLMPRRDVAPATADAGLPTGQDLPVGTIVSLPSHAPLVAHQSVAQR